MLKFFKKALRVIFLAGCAIFPAYVTIIFALMSGMGGIPEDAAEFSEKLILASLTLGVVAFIISFFPLSKLSFLIFVAQCFLFAGVIYMNSHLVPAERERNLRANYKKINTRVLSEAETVLACDDGHRVAYIAPVTTNIGRSVATLNLVPPDLEDEPHQILSVIDGRAGDVFIKHSHRHLKAVLPSCKNDTMTFDELSAKIRNM